MVYRHKRLVWVVIALGLVSGSASGQKSFHYRALSVDARLDSAGVLHVSERQEMVLTGDWNGGERIFHVRERQRFRFRGISRLVAGRLQPLSQGDLSAVDTFQWQDRFTLRWRSRLPGMPPFDNTTLTYVIDYELSNILIPRQAGYLLDHDFAFPDRQARIEQFSARLALDPPWKSDQPVGTIRAGPLDPGQGYVLTLPLTYATAGSPAGVLFPASPLFRYVLLAAFIASLFLLSVLFYRGENSVGRFSGVTPVSEIDEKWLRENIFQHLPEVVGAAWDGQTGPPEVAAVLARMESEEKIRSEVKTTTSWFRSKPVLHLTLLVDRDKLEGYEKKLINGLFFKGSTTDTESLAQHYRHKGFHPASLISGRINEQVDALAGSQGGRPKPSWKFTCLLALPGALLLLAAGLSRPYELPLVGGVAVAALILRRVGKVAALPWQNRVQGQARSSPGFVIPLALLAGGIGWLIWAGPWDPSRMLLAGSVFLCLGVVNSVLNAARTRRGPEWVSVRLKFAAAREYFRQELKKPNPRLQDDWFPYLVAFGLGDNVDQWFKDYGTTVGRTDRFGSFGKDEVGQSVSSSSTSSRPGWSGGGGLSGGAGAGRSWALAAGTIGAGVSSSSSSSGGTSDSGGSSSSTSGSSGGGGGGAW